MVRLIRDYDLKKGRQHNVEIILKFSALLRHGWGLVNGHEHWAKVFIFDALIGNTDRHQDNWGILWHGLNPNESTAIFAPAFDNGTALGHEITEENLPNFQDPTHVNRYINRGRHHFRWSHDDPRRCGHIELITKLAQRHPELRGVMVHSLSFDIDELEADIRDLCNFDVSVPLSVERSSFVLILVRERQQRLLAALNQENA